MELGAEDGDTADSAQIRSKRKYEPSEPKFSDAQESLRDRRTGSRHVVPTAMEVCASFDIFVGAPSPVR